MMDPTGWVRLPRSHPEEQGIASQAIINFIEGLSERHQNVHSFMLVRHGCVVAEAWWAPFRPENRRYVYSLSKSFTSAGVGLCVADGLLSVDDKVISFFPDKLPETVGENLAAMRVRDLLTMSTGHAFDAMMAILTPDAGDWVRTLLSQWAEYSPGTRFVYNSGATYLLSAIVQKVSGRSLMEALSERLFGPLGIVDVTWDTCPEGRNTGGWGLSIRTEDIAKFGLLYLQRGIWNGQALLPEEWIEASTKPQIRTDGPGRENEPADWTQGYGYQFWQCQHGAYRADGAAGQYCVIMPEQEAVVVITSETDHMQTILDLVWEHLLPAMNDRPLPANATGRQRLGEKLSALKIDPPEYGTPPAWAASLSGKRVALAENGLGIGSVAFSFGEGSTRFRVWDARGENAIECGNGGWIKNETILPLMQPTMMGFLLHRSYQDPIQVAASGSWVDENTYVMKWQYLETPHFDTVTCRFKGDDFELEIASSFEGPHNPFLVGREGRFGGRIDGSE